MKLGSRKGWYLRDLNQEQRDQIEKELKKELHLTCINYWDNWDRWTNGRQTRMIMNINPRFDEFR